ncbi:uncharacterized protein [Arachis hypogaea]|uniref:uncharacterized protein isoform X2 n=1 Tax=Arachis hypogaea TaxID=3818 RepID=UPI003B214072
MGLKSSNSTSELVKHDSEGQCNSKCKTIEQVCQEVIGYLDTDVAEYLYNSKPDTDSLYKYLCKDPTKACSTKPPPVPKVPSWKQVYWSNTYRTWQHVEIELPVAYLGQPSSF